MGNSIIGKKGLIMVVGVEGRGVEGYCSSGAEEHVFILT